jgi:ketosteroid isomerase-like protein
VTRLALQAAVLMLLITPAWSASCANGQAKDEATLLQLEQTWAKALEEHDANTVSCLTADEFQDAGTDGAVHDRAAVLARVPKRGPNSNHLDDMHAHLYGDVAYVRGVNQVSDPSGKLVARVRFTDIFVYREGRWQAVAGQETLMSEADK